MRIYTVGAGLLGVNCYIVTFDDVLCCVIDPGDEADKIMNVISSKGLKADKILLTHGHFDHFGGANKLKKLTGAKLYISQKDAPMLNNDAINAAGMFSMQVEHTLSDGFLTDSVQVGEGVLKVIPTPGHSEGSVCFYSQKENVLFSGDTLFCSGVGRTDFYGGNFNTLENSIREKLFILPDETKVYPGHNGMTTIGNEKKFNPFL